MVLEYIYLTRHGFRATWVLDPQTGTYTSSVPSPTGIAADAPLVSYGVDQARQLSEHLLTLDPPIDRAYSSPYTRCLQTLQPAVRKVRALKNNGEERRLEGGSEWRGRWAGEVRGENGFGEWFGQAQFQHPSPASPAVLRSLFPFYSPTYTPVLHPPSVGETIDELHERVAYVLSRVIADLDADPSGPRSALICTHAATLIAIGRVLTGHMPIDAEKQDFLPFTAGLSVFVRRSGDGAHKRVAVVGGDVEELVPDTHKSGNGGTRKEEDESDAGVEPRSANTLLPAKIDWRQGKGVQGGWTCVKNGDCSFLSGGAERGWKFGDP